MENGHFEEAAQAFARLAEAAQRHQMPVRAAHLALQAARAYLATDDVRTAVAWAGHGLELLAREGQTSRASRLLGRVQEELRERGYEEQAARLAERIDLPPEAPSPAEGSDEDYDALPAQCPGCGAPLTPDTVEWRAEGTASCVYCGAVAKTR
jgi:hypothetical protein